MGRLIIALAFSFAMALPLTLSVFFLLAVRMIAFLGVPLLLAWAASMLIGGVLSTPWVMWLQSMELPSVSDSELAETTIGVYAIVFIIVLILSFMTVGKWINRFFSRLDEGELKANILFRIVWIAINTLFAMMVITVGLLNMLDPSVGQDTQAVVNLFYASTIPGVLWGLLCGTLFTRWANKIWAWVGEAENGTGFQAPIPVYIRHW